MGGQTEQSEHRFELFAKNEGERVRRALVGFYGVEVGSEAAAEAMAVAWERWADVDAMNNPAGYLFRIGQSKVRPLMRWKARRISFPGGDPAGPSTDSDALVDLFTALRRLNPIERTVVLLVKSYGHSYRDVARLLEISEAAVGNHLHRGLGRLRIYLEVTP
jgi:DNA-directed RNA polymerase specialized sigma24 family protein